MSIAWLVVHFEGTAHKTFTGGGGGDSKKGKSSRQRVHERSALMPQAILGVDVIRRSCVRGDLSPIHSAFLFVGTIGIHRDEMHVISFPQLRYSRYRDVPSYRKPLISPDPPLRGPIVPCCATASLIQTCYTSPSLPPAHQGPLIAADGASVLDGAVAG